MARYLKNELRAVSTFREEVHDKLFSIGRKRTVKLALAPDRTLAVEIDWHR